MSNINVKHAASEHENSFSKGVNIHNAPSKQSLFYALDMASKDITGKIKSKKLYFSSLSTTNSVYGTFSFYLSTALAICHVSV